MPLEVREIGIRLQVQDPSGATGADPSREGDPGAGAQGLTAAERAAIVEQCTRAVLAALAEREER